jgi:hypothetical protein
MLPAPRRPMPELPAALPESTDVIPAVTYDSSRRRTHARVALAMPLRKTGMARRFRLVGRKLHRLIGQRDRPRSPGPHRRRESSLTEPRGGVAEPGHPNPPLPLRHARERVARGLVLADLQPSPDGGQVTMKWRVPGAMRVSSSARNSLPPFGAHSLFAAQSWQVSSVVRVMTEVGTVRSTSRGPVRTAWSRCRIVRGTIGTQLLVVPVKHVTETHNCDGVVTITTSGTLRGVNLPHRRLNEAACAADANASIIWQGHYYTYKRLIGPIHNL